MPSKEHEDAVNVLAPLLGMETRLWKRRLKEKFEGQWEPRGDDPPDWPARDWGFPGFTPDAFRFDDEDGLVTILEVELTSRLTKRRGDLILDLVAYHLDHFDFGWEVRVLIANPRIRDENGIPVVTDAAKSVPGFPDHCGYWRKFALKDPSNFTLCGVAP